MKQVFRLSLYLGVVVFSSAVATLWMSCEKSYRVDSSVAYGRQVYISEGCIHCHSQYIRPVGQDRRLWGAPTSVEQAYSQEPVLIGNRRQGPDLANVALRRPREWNRLHLLAPDQLMPGSRMPSFSYLFEAGDPRGPALLDYLDQLKPELNVTDNPVVPATVRSRDDENSAGRG
ncbi:cbb3-type cytochrome c oxidase subunit II [Coraliomargarita parva]|uniref:cbb3-type cytochrome c oxidase subunit II n=1 Tax=Coraliomargarita parva TaxID=3014050 RepID=UPI0022B3E426|nr:cbb3-type cytochrome c oxidase subunit II [Coraliomargarita parva]